MFRARVALAALALGAAAWVSHGVAVAEMPEPAAAPRFDGTWTLARISDGRRSRDDLDESLTIVTGTGFIHLDYAIADRFGRRRLVLDAPVDGSPAAQSVEGRPCTVTVTMRDDVMTLELARHASFGKMHNRRVMRLSSDGQSIESERSNFERDGSVSSSWHEVWVRRPSDAPKGE